VKCLRAIPSGSAPALRRSAAASHGALPPRVAARPVLQMAPAAAAARSTRQRGAPHERWCSAVVAAAARLHAAPPVRCAQPRAAPFWRFRRAAAHVARSPLACRFAPFAARQRRDAYLRRAPVCRPPARRACHSRRVVAAPRRPCRAPCRQKIEVESAENGTRHAIGVKEMEDAAEVQMAVSSQRGSRK